MEDKRIEIHEKMACLELKIDQIINNDLAHLHAQMNKIEGRLWWVLGTVVIGQLATLTIAVFALVCK